MRERVLENIRHECRKFLRDGKEMPKRDPRWDVDIEIIMKEEKRILEQEQQEEIEQLYANYHKKHVSGITYEEWLDKAKKLYRVTGSIVTSIALGPDHERVFGPYKTEKQAHKKFLQLLYYKQYDHFVRGHDFAYDPEKD